MLDGAGCRSAQDLILPDNLTLLHLPRYAPELNPIKNIWDVSPQEQARRHRLRRLRRHH
ncbi:transposase [Sinorhizobium numidicum]|uniref:transposase n=1 Tax=Sinorhizobium numidicum TaxID=680248 RepID=UPI003CC8E039